jgi:CBS domain-containing protein
MPQCKDVMTPNPASCEPNDSIRHVAEIMQREDVGAVPVVEGKESRRLVGIVTDRDVTIKIVAAGGGGGGCTGGPAQTTHPASVREDEDVARGVSLMAERQVRRMPVVDGQGRLSGIIAQADVATRVNKDTQTGQMVEAISEPRTFRQ